MTTDPKMSYDYESYTEPLASTGNMEFSDKSIRMGFIRKVYMILMAQLTVTFGMVAVFTLSADVNTFVNKTPALFYVALAGTLVCIIALSCCGNLRRRTPFNFIFLGLFTVCEGFLLGTAAASFTKGEILIAVGVTFVVTLSLTLFAFQTNWTRSDDLGGQEMGLSTQPVMWHPVIKEGADIMRPVGRSPILLEYEA
ncbi:lifeguard 3-like [Homarus americanus]|uniref:Lifeguard 3-like n=1 Tax=Homarus americanus TaxID=6706 RepID=A0A8J5MYT6_HOMAM|nr:lifeguard 3-like [Homarus americanus]